MAKEPKQGEIWIVDFDPVQGHEQSGLRPALVLSRDSFNGSGLDLMIVVPVTTRARGWNVEVPVSATDVGLNLDSVILAHQVRTVSVNRFENQVGQVPSATLDAVIAITQRLISRPAATHS